MTERPLAPHGGYLFSRDIEPLQASIPARNRKASSACLACKQRKSKCCQGTPCKLCLIHRSACKYDETADQRRRVSRQRLLDEHQSQRVFLLGLIAVIRTQGPIELQKLLDLIRSEVPLPQVSSYVEQMLAVSPELSEACRRLSLGSYDPQDVPLFTALPEDTTRPAQLSRRVSGLPMNAQIILSP